MGEAPDWFQLVRASQFWGVPPWVLLAQPGAPAWIEMAVQTMAAESHRQEMLDKRRKKPGGFR